MGRTRTQSFIDLLNVAAISGGLICLAICVSIPIIAFSKDWTATLTSLITAWSTIALAIIAMFALSENRKLIVESKKDRKVAHIKTQLDEFYMHLITYDGGFPDCFDPNEAELFYLRQKMYLAEPELKRLLKEYVPTSLAYVRSESLLKDLHDRKGPFYTKYPGEDATIDENIKLRKREGDLRNQIFKQVGEDITTLQDRLDELLS